MRDTHRSPLRAPVWLAAGLVAGLCLAPHPASTQSEVTPAQLEELVKRLEALEERLGGEAAAPAEGGLVLKAPFKVTNEQGQTVFEVEAEGSKVEVTVGIGEVNVSMETAGQDGAKLEVSGGIDHSLELAAAPAATSLEIAQGSSAELTLGFLDQGETGIEISAGNETVFEVKTGGEGESLSLGAEAGNQAKLEAGEEATLTLGQGEEPAVQLAALDNGGELSLGSGQEPVVGLSAEGDEGKLELGGAEAAATLSGKGEVGALTLGKESGKRAELNTEGTGGLLELSKGGEAQVTLEAASEGGQLLLGPGGEPTLKLTSKAGGGEIFAGEAEGKKVQIGITAGNPVVQVSDNDKRIALTAVGEIIGISVVSPEGAAVLGKGPNGWGLDLGKQGTKMAMLGTTGQQKLALTLYSNNAPTTVLKADNDGGALTFGVGAKPKVELKSNDKGGQMELGNTDAAKVQLGTMGSDSIVQVSKSEERAFLIAGGEQVGAMAKTSDGFAELGKHSKGGFGFMLTKQSQPVANLGTYEGRSAALRVFSSQGSQIIAAGQGPEGGGTVRVFPSNGGASYAQMDAFPSGGYVGAFLPNGSPFAAFDGSERVVAVYNDAALPVATLGLGSNGNGGNVTTRDSGGTGVFSAGATSDGGTACVIHKGKIHCLGIGLPLMGGGN